MAWQITEPTDNTKIRDLGVVIRPNWAAIQTASSSFTPDAFNLRDRTVAGLPVDPTAIADVYSLFCKTDAAGNSELFGIDDNSVVSQFTSTDRLLAQNGYAVIPPGILVQWGRGFMAGATFTVAVAFLKAFSSPAWIVVDTPYNTTLTGSTGRQFGVDESTITDIGFSAYNFNGAVPGGGVNFGWFAIGPL